MSTAPDLTKTLGTGLSFLGTFVYASLPSAASWSGYTAIASDIGIAPGMLLVSDGTRWLPLGVQVLARVTTSSTIAADTNEDTAATIVVPANLMGINGGVRITMKWSFTSSTNLKTWRMRFGGTQIQTGATVTTGQILIVAQAYVFNRAATNSQIGGGDMNGYATGATNSTAAIDTTAAVNITLTGQKATGSETMTLEHYMVELLP